MQSMYYNIIIIVHARSINIINIALCANIMYIAYNHAVFKKDPIDYMYMI